MLRSFYFYFFTFFNQKLEVPQVPQVPEVPEVPRSADPQFSNTPLQCTILLHVNSEMRNFLLKLLLIRLRLKVTV